jgi:hypothetical protein
MTEQSITHTLPMVDAYTVGGIAADLVASPTFGQLQDLMRRFDDLQHEGMLRRRYEKSDLHMWLDIARSRVYNAPGISVRVKKAFKGTHKTIVGRWLHETSMSAGAVVAGTPAQLTRQAALAFSEAVLYAPPVAAGSTGVPATALADEVAALVAAWPHLRAEYLPDVCTSPAWWWEVHRTAQRPTLSWLRQHPALLGRALVLHPWFEDWWRAALMAEEEALEKEAARRAQELQRRATEGAFPRSGGSGPVYKNPWYETYKPALNAVDYTRGWTAPNQYWDPTIRK